MSDSRRGTIIARWQSIHVEPLPDSEPRYSAAEAAGRSGLSTQALARFERLGLLDNATEPSRPARYSDRDVDRLRRVHRVMTDLSIDLATAEIILHMRDQIVVLQHDIAHLLADGEPGGVHQG